jgi:hypothetical protein
MNEQSKPQFAADVTEGFDPGRVDKMAEQMLSIVTENYTRGPADAARVMESLTAVAVIAAGLLCTSGLSRRDRKFAQDNFAALVARTQWVMVQDLQSR